MHTYSLIRKSQNNEAGSTELVTVGTVTCGTISQATRKLFRAHKINPQDPKGHAVVFQKMAKTEAK